MRLEVNICLEAKMVIRKYSGEIKTFLSLSELGIELDDFMLIIT